MTNRGAADTLLSRMARDCEIERAGKGRYSLSNAFVSPIVALEFYSGTTANGLFIVFK